MKPAVVRFYIDQDILGLKVLARIRSDVTYPGDPGATIHKRQRPPCPIKPGELDIDWLPVVAERGWLVLTRDSQIQQHRAEINAVRDCGAKMVALASRDASNTWGQLEIVMTQWRTLEELVDLPGPFIYTASRVGGLRRIA